MPIIKSAIKKMRKDKLRTERNAKRLNGVKRLLKQARKSPSAAHSTSLFSALDKAVKVNLIHANKAARLKSRVAKLTSAK